MAAAPSASIPTAVRCRSPASTIIPARAPSGRRVRTPPLPASQNRRRPRSIRKPLPLQRLLRPSRQQHRRPAPPAPAAPAATTEPSTTTATIAPADTAVAPPAPPPRAAAGDQQDARRRRPGSDDCRGAAVITEPAAIRGCPGQFAARRLADRREGRQGPHRAMRRQSLRLLGRREVEPERRAGADQHEAGKDLKWTGRILDPNTGSTYDSTIALNGSDYAARAGLRLRRHVLRRPDLDARGLTIVLRISQVKGPAASAGPFVCAPVSAVAQSPRARSVRARIAPAAFDVTPITFFRQPCDDVRVQHRARHGTVSQRNDRHPHPVAVAMRFAAPAAAATFDGEWNVQIPSKSAACSNSASVSIGISNGQVASTSATLSGRRPRRRGRHH